MVNQRQYVQKWKNKPISLEQLIRQKQRQCDIREVENDFLPLTLIEAAKALNIGMDQLLKLSLDGIAPYFATKHRKYPNQNVIVYARASIERFKQNLKQRKRKVKNV